MKKRSLATLSRHISSTKVLRYALMLVLVGIGLAFLFSESHHLSTNDFIEYWSGSRINFMGGNPYSPVDLLQEQKLSGWPEAEPKLMVYPPWIFPLVILFGAFSRSVAQMLWLLFQIGILLFCSHQLWILYRGPVEKRWMALIIPFIFAPTIIVLEFGQITPLILLGVIGFVSFIDHSRNDWLAGASLVLVSIKPQLLFVFWIAVIFWIIQQRRWKVLIGAVVSVSILMLITMLFNLQVISQYLVMLQTNAVSVWASPTIGMYLRRFWLGTENFWPQFLPPVIASLCFLLCWLKFHDSWNWLRSLPVLLLVTMITSPYTWTYDLVILLPVIIQGSVWLVEYGKRLSTYLLAGFFLLISILDLALHTRLNDFWFIWVAPMMLVWYLLVYKQRSNLTVGSTA